MTTYKILVTVGELFHQGFTHEIKHIETFVTIAYFKDRESAHHVCEQLNKFMQIAEIMKLEE